MGEPEVVAQERNPRRHGHTVEMNASVDDLDALSGYPGRGIVVHRAPDDELHWVYFLTGRSPSSQARRFVRRPGALAVAPTDADAQFDELRHYLCATGVDGTHQIVVGNGDHVATITQLLAEGAGLATAADELAPEPDPPINTPRIAAVLAPNQVELVIVRDVGGQPDRVIQPVELEVGEAVLLCTYAGDVAEPLASAPVSRFQAPRGTPLSTLIWDALHPSLRVILAAGTARSAEPDLLIP